MPVGNQSMVGASRPRAFAGYDKESPHNDRLPPERTRGAETPSGLEPHWSKIIDVATD